MENDKTPILAKKYVSTLLIFLLEKGTVHKTDLLAVIHSNTTIDKLVNELKNENFLSVRKEFAGRNTYYISLTDKGKEAAQKLKEAQDVAERKNEIQVHEDDEKIDLKLSDKEAEKAKHLRLLYHINVLDDHVTVEELSPGKPPRVFNIYIKKNGGENFRLWCEEDNSYDCWHVKAAWTYPAVQKMMTEYKYKAKVYRYCKTVNDPDADYCKHCGAKLE